MRLTVNQTTRLGQITGLQIAIMNEFSINYNNKKLASMRSEASKLDHMDPVNADPNPICANSNTIAVHFLHSLGEVINET